MPSGGARPNAGRKAGVAHGHTREILDKAAADGVLPLQVMLDNIRFYKKEASELLAKLMVGDVPPTPDAETGNHPVVEAIGQVLGLRKLAGEEAARAAPYCHPRQGVMVADDDDEHFVPLHDRLAAYQRRDDIEAAGGKVVELKPGK